MPSVWGHKASFTLPREAVHPLYFLDTSWHNTELSAWDREDKKRNFSIAPGNIPTDLLHLQSASPGHLSFPLVFMSHPLPIRPSVTWEPLGISHSYSRMDGTEQKLNTYLWNDRQSIIILGKAYFLYLDLCDRDA